MRGLMQEQPLVISSLIEHAERSHPEREIVSRSPEGLVRTSYGAVGERARRMAAALQRMGIDRGERVATLAWNDHRHMELYYAVSGMGAVLHTINPRLFAEQVEYIVNHAEDRVIFFAPGFASLLEKLADRLPTVRAFVAMCARQQMPAAALPNLLCYEDLLDVEPIAWPEVEENAAATLCYTSGTTGDPKGVLYSHRSTVLHAFAACGVDGLGVGSADTALLVVPMFHVNAWGMPYAGAMSGAKLVLPGPALDGASVYALLRDEKVTLALGVPTVWLMLFRHVDEQRLSPQRELVLQRCIIGGSAAPQAMIERFEQEFGCEAIQAWGMTELSPLGTVSRLRPEHAALPAEARRQIQLKQGRAVFGVRMKIVDDEGRELPRDGASAGLLKVKGPWVAGAYYGCGPATDADGWFDTGDVATIDAEGYMQITDRAKDVIKSGGEWISSIDLENAAMGHPAVAEAAVIGLHHPQWQERPLLVVVRKQGQALEREEMLAFLAWKVAKWWLPDDVAFVDSLPHTATGKLQKAALRRQFGHYRWPEA
ncbi:MAG TPA: long-chain-fatty-acid--CoA ligase [Pseudoduganella sp.]